MSVTASDASADTWTKLDTWAAPRAAARNDTWTRTVQLLNNPAASAAARDHVKRVIKAWNAGIGGHPALGAACADAAVIDDDTVDTAVLLTSELVTNAITHGESPVTVAVTWSAGQLRVEVHDKSRFMPAPWPVIESPDAETGRGLLLVDTLAADWGFYRTPGGKAVYFTLDCGTAGR